MLEDTFSSLFDDVSDVNQNTTADMVSLFASPVHFVHTTLDHPDTNRDQEIQDPKDIIFKKCKALLAERSPTNSNYDGTYY